jgi:SAM-dependent methyltransferase
VSSTSLASVGAIVSALQPWHEVAEPIYQRAVNLGDPAPNAEILWVGAGAARAAAWWALKRRVHTAAVDPSGRTVAWAERAARGSGIASLVTLQHGRPDDLPHEADVFDLVVTTIVFDPTSDPGEAIRQAVRVVRPLSPVVLVLPMWLGAPHEQAEGVLGVLGLRPRFLTVWKQAVRDAGLVEVSAEELPRDGHWLADGILRPAARAWYAAGFGGARAVFSPAVRLLRRLARQRALGLGMLRGVKWSEA